VYAFAFHTIIFIHIKPLFNSKQKSTGKKKNPLKKRNIRLTIINALNLISCFKFIQLFLIFISINRFTCKEKSAGQKKCPLITYALFLIFISINRFMYKEKSAGERKSSEIKKYPLLNNILLFLCIYIYVIFVKARKVPYILSGL
jgi:hypothetical protein